MYVPLSALREAIRLVESLADLDDPADFAGLALPRMARLVGCDSLSFAVIGAEPRQVSVICQPACAASPAILEAFAGFAHEHPLVSHYRNTGDERPARISDFLSQRRFHQLGLYAEVFRYIPVEYQIAFPLPASGTDVIGIALNRAARDFTDDDRDLLTVVRTPLLTALLRARDRQRAQEGLAAANCGGLVDLTDREVRVLRLAALGRTNAAIAHALDVSPRTVASTSNTSTASSTSPAGRPPSSPHWPGRRSEERRHQAP